MRHQKQILPYNLIAEKIVLGTILTNSDAINFVCQILPIEAFYLKSHQYIYRAALVLNANNQTVDLITLSNWLQDNNLIEKIGGLGTLNNLVEKIVGFINLNEYTALIQDKYIRRLLIIFGNEIVKLGYQTNLPLEKTFAQIERKLFKLSKRKKFKNLSTTGEILTEILLEIKKNENVENFNGYKSNFEDLNLITQGFQKSDLIVIAGRPAMGKTAFALNVTLDIAIKYNIPVIFFSLEMTKYQLMYRLLTIETKINTNRIKTAQLNEIEWKNVNKAVKKLSNLPLYIDDTGTISLSEIHFRIQKIKLQFGKIGFVVIDYLQLLETVQKNENRVQEISKITRSLKGFAREFDTPIFVLSQLSRNVESRTNKRPILSDLRESGCIYFNDCLSSNLNQIGVYQHNKNLIMKTKKFKIKSSGLKPVFLVKNFINLTTNLTANHKLLTNLKWQRIDECNYLTIGKFSFFLPKKKFKINC